MDFIFGIASSAYQIEGDSDRAKCIWDKGSKGSGIACDHYHRYEEDIRSMHTMGIRHYRFSISWCRMLEGKVAIDYYNDLINELIRNDITPYVTLYHWDMPLGYSWLDKEVIKLFLNYADLCFRCFSDRVKFWFTFNEPWCIAILGHCLGNHAPYLSDRPGIDPYIVAHNILLAHGEVVKLFREKYSGRISIVLNSPWWEPVNEDDKIACQRAMTFSLDWFLSPIRDGDYPVLMRDIVGDRLPIFSDYESLMIKGSIDFLSINHYFTLFGGSPKLSRLLVNLRSVNINTIWKTISGSHYFNDMNVMCESVDIRKSDMDWYIYPPGIRKLLEYIGNDYEIYITENGMSIDGLDDDERIEYITSYLTEIKEAIKSGSRVSAYFLWSLMDNFEWDHGYSKQFGIMTRDRVWKKSAHFYSQLIHDDMLKFNIF